MKPSQKSLNAIAIAAFLFFIYLFYLLFFNYETFKITSVNQEHILISKKPKSNRNAVTIKVEGHFNGRANLFLGALAQDSTIMAENQVLYNFLGDIDTSFTLDFYERIPVLRFEPTPAHNGYVYIGIK